MYVKQLNVAHMYTIYEEIFLVKYLSCVKFFVAFNFRGSSYVAIFVALISCSRQIFMCLIFVGEPTHEICFP